MANDISVGNLIVSVATQLADFKKGMGDINSSLDKLKDRAQKGRTSINKIGLAIGGAGLGLTAVLGAAALKTIGLNKEMARIGTLIPGNVKRVKELQKGVQDMAISVGKSTSDLTDGAFQIISAFGDSADTIAQLEIAAKAAAAGGATTTESINLLSAVTKGYGDTSKEALQKVADLAFKTNELGQTTFPELASSMGKVVPLSSELGVSQEELFAVMATGTGVTGNAAEVSTQLRGVLQALLAPTADMTNAMDAMGIESGKALLEQQGLAGSIDFMIEAAKATGQPLQKFIGSIEGQTIALALSGSQSDVFNEKLEAMELSAGAATIAFEEQTQGVNSSGFAIEQAKVAISVLVQTIGQFLIPKIGQMAKILVDVIKQATNIIENNQDLIQAALKTFIGFIGKIIDGWLGLLNFVDDIFESIVGIIGKALGKVFKAFKFLFEKIGIDLPDISEIFENVGDEGENAIKKVTAGWEDFKAGFDKQSDEMAAKNKETTQKIIQDQKNITFVQKSEEKARITQSDIAREIEEQKAVNAEKKKQDKLEKEREKADKKRLAQQEQLFKKIDAKFGESLTAQELEQAKTLAAMDGDWEGFIKETIEAKLPTGFEKAMLDVRAKVAESFDRIGDDFNESIISGNFSEAFDGLRKGILDTMTSAFADVLTDLEKNFFKKLVSGLVDSLTSGLGGLGGKLGGLLGGDKKGIKGLLGTAGPILGVLGPVGIAAGAFLGVASLLGFGKKGKSAAKDAEEYLDSFGGDVDAALANYMLRNKLNSLEYQRLRLLWEAIGGEGRSLLLDSEEPNVLSWSKQLASGKFPIGRIAALPKGIKGFFPPDFLHGGIIPGMFGQKQLIMAHGGEEVVRRDDPRHQLNMGGININITGNNISSELDLVMLARRAAQEIMKPLKFQTKFVR